MIRHFECSIDEFLQRSRSGDQPETTWRKCLYLEWFSHRNGRVVIQSARLAVERLGERAFELTQEQWVAQAKQNSEEMTFFMHQLGDALNNAPADQDESGDCNQFNRLQIQSKNVHDHAARSIDDRRSENRWHLLCDHGFDAALAVSIVTP